MKRWRAVCLSFPPARQAVLADLVENGWNGRVVSPGDIDQLAAAMDELARDAELRSLMGQRSRERIEQYSPEAWAAGMASAVLPHGRRAA